MGLAWLDPGVDKRGAVAVSAMFPKRGQRLPQEQVWIAGNIYSRVRGCQRAAGRLCAVDCPPG
jgi:hypothetical protein